MISGFVYQAATGIFLGPLDRPFLRLSVGDSGFGHFSSIVFAFGGSRFIGPAQNSQRGPEQ